MTACATRGGAAPLRSRHRRSYDSGLRRQRAAETRERIVAAGSELLHGSSVRDWHGLTIRAVAERRASASARSPALPGRAGPARRGDPRTREGGGGHLRACVSRTSPTSRHGSSPSLLLSAGCAPAAGPNAARCQAAPARGPAHRRRRAAGGGPIRTARWRPPSSTCCGAWPATSAWSWTGRWTPPRPRAASVG